jgi:radical SAM protein with 4Fe4S-binding SPASM domain
MSGPISDIERIRLLEAKRPRHALPIFGDPSQVRRLPLARASRDIDQRDRPVYAVWELTLKCDLSCRHCGSRAGPERPGELALHESLDLVRQLAELGLKEVTLIGGEAYLYSGWLDVIRAIRAHGMKCSLVTGGRHWTDERARGARAAGLQSVGISIDGDEITHDRLRGADGAHRAALAAIAVSRQVGLPVSVNTQVNRLSLPHLPEVLEVVKRAGAHGWQVQLTVPAGRAADEPEVVLQPFDLLALYPMLARLKQECDRHGIVFLAGNNVGYFGPLDHVIRQISPCGHSTSCTAGRLGLGIESNGDVKGCPSLPSDAWVGGNIRQHTLRDIYERAPALRFNRDRTVGDLWGFCRSCYYADDCRAGCTWMSSSLFGRPGNNPYCHHRALEHAKMNRRERLVLAEPAPGRSFDHGRWRLIVEDVPPAENAEQEEENP